METKLIRWLERDFELHVISYIYAYFLIMHSIRQPVSTHDFRDVSQAVKFGGSKGVPGASAVAGVMGECSELGRKLGAGRWRTVVTKRASRSGQAT